MLVDNGEARAAEPLARQSLAILRKILPAQNRNVARAQSVLGYSLLAQHRLAEAEAELRASYSDIVRGFGLEARDSVRARRWIERLYGEIGKPDEARKLHRRRRRSVAASQGPRNIL